LRHALAWRCAQGASIHGLQLVDHITANANGGQTQCAKRQPEWGAGRRLDFFCGEGIANGGTIFIIIQLLGRAWLRFWLWRCGALLWRCAGFQIRVYAVDMLRQIG
jgi:hypothetical protein